MQKLFQQKINEQDDTTAFSKFAFGRVFDRPTNDSTSHEEKILNNSFFKNIPRINDKGGKFIKKTDKNSISSSDASIQSKKNDDVSSDPFTFSSNEMDKNNEKLQNDAVVNHNPQQKGQEPAESSFANIETMKAESYQQGYDDGQREFEHPIAEKQTLLLQKIADELTKICDNQASLKSNYIQCLSDILDITLHEVIPVAISSQFYKKLKDELLRNIPSIENFTHVHIKYHPNNQNDIDSLKDELLAEHPEFNDKISFSTDPHLTIGEVEFQQGKGGTHFNSHDYAKNVRALALQYFKNSYIEDAVPATPSVDMTNTDDDDVGKEQIISNDSEKFEKTEETVTNAMIEKPTDETAQNANTTEKTIEEKEAKDQPDEEIENNHDDENISH